MHFSSSAFTSDKLLNDCKKLILNNRIFEYTRRKLLVTAADQTVHTAVILFFLTKTQVKFRKPFYTLPVVGQTRLATSQNFFRFLWLEPQRSAVSYRSSPSYPWVNEVACSPPKKTYKIRTKQKNSKHHHEPCEKHKNDRHTLTFKSFSSRHSLPSLSELLSRFATSASKTRKRFNA